MTENIKKYCEDTSVEYLGELGFDRDFVAAMFEGKTIVEYSKGESANKIRNIRKKIQS